jgi:hypothetical protein
MFQLEFPFFGLTPEHKEQLILEPLFILMYYGGFTYTEAYNLPVRYKLWFVSRIAKELKRSQEGQAPEGDRTPTNNTPETAALMGRVRSANTAARNRRFT